MKDDLYASHLPILAGLVENTKENIVEFGMGFSTTLLHAMCKQTERKIFSYENDRKWYEKFKGYECDWHEINYVEDWDTIPTLQALNSLVFLDHRPAMRRRVDALRLKYTANIIVLHDSEPEMDKFFGYKRIYPEFEYVYQYTACKPHTAVLSNFIDLSFLKTTI